MVRISTRASRLPGPPTVYPSDGNAAVTWTFERRPMQERQWVELEFTSAVEVQGVDIYETLNPGAVVCVQTLRGANVTSDNPRRAMAGAVSRGAVTMYASDAWSSASGPTTSAYSQSNSTATVWDTGMRLA